MEFAEFDIEFLALKMSENPQSMLFARLADLYLVKEQPAEAMKLLEEGIKNFPTYHAGYIVLGKAHLAFNEYSKAHGAFEQALNLSPFNQTARKLLASIPNKPDESTRTTDENYFSPPSEQSVTASAETQFTSPAEQTFEMTEQPNDETTPSNEYTISQSVEEISGSIYDQMPTQHTYAAPEHPEAPPSGDAFPSYDDYFAQNQHRTNVETTVALDDYLSGAAVPIAPVAQEFSVPKNEFVNDSFESPAPEQEVHSEPEPVFASPEQARLFAEMTGIDQPMETETQSGTDIDMLAEKLQSAEKIVPQENYQPQTPAPKESEDDKAYETDAVTPTLAEIYASQGEYRAAIQAYEILMFSHPAKGGEFQKRIRELQQIQMEKDGLI